MENLIKNKGNVSHGKYFTTIGMEEKAQNIRAMRIRGNA